MNNGHNLSFERSSGYGGYRCKDCGEWFHQQAVNWNDLKPCPFLKQEYSVSPSEHSVAVAAYAMKLTPKIDVALCSFHDMFKRGLPKDEDLVKTVKFPIAIHSPSDIEVGKKYVNNSVSNVVYLGCKNYDTEEKFMLIIGYQEEDYNDFTGITASNNVNFPIWTNGFTLQ